MDAFNAMGNLVRSPPITINEMALTLEHVIRRLEVIENKMSTVEHIKNLDKMVHNQVTKFGSTMGTTLNMLKKKEPIITKRVEQGPARIDKLEEVINNMVHLFLPLKLLKGLLEIRILNLCMVLRKGWLI